jgi:hypothetical protein
MSLSVRNLPQIRLGSATPEQLYEALQDIIRGHDNIAQQTNANPNGTSSPPPPDISSFVVTGADGIYHAQITDNNPVYRGVHYHIQYSTDRHFVAPITVHLGPARDWRANLGNRSIWWRAFSDYGSVSSHSTPIYHGGAAPIAVTAPPSVAGNGPAIPPGQGSGTGNAGQISGFGPIPFRTITGKVPVRK